MPEFARLELLDSLIALNRHKLGLILYVIDLVVHGLQH